MTGQRKVYSVAPILIFLYSVLPLPFFAITALVLRQFLVEPNNFAIIGFGIVFGVIGLLAILNLISFIRMRLILSDEGIEYQSLGYKIFARWSEIQSIETWGRVGTFAKLERCVTSGNWIVGVFLRPLAGPLDIPLAYRWVQLWGKDIIPEILAYTILPKQD